ncbi:MAG: hypothetical protein ABIP47_03860 [Saprospiraceae bacterium]
MICILGLVHFLPAQISNEDSKFTKKGLPNSFLIGEFEHAYDELLEEYSRSLVSVCDNSNDKAYSIWSNVLVDINEQSKISNMDLNGLKLWINIFFENDGTIQHIVYYPKPNSKNMDFDKLTSFFTSFCKSYKMNVPLSSKCMLSATASFPLNVNK